MIAVWQFSGYIKRKIKFSVCFYRLLHPLLLYVKQGDEVSLRRLLSLLNIILYKLLDAIHIGAVIVHFNCNHFNSEMLKN